MAIPRGSGLYRLVRFVVRQLAFAYFRLGVRGVSRLPVRGPVIIAGNHPNVLDGILLVAVSPRPVRFLIAEELYFHRYLHWLFAGLGGIPVYRTRSENGDALRAAVAALQRGEVLAIFPEGTTADRGRMHEVKRGVGILACRSGAPVVPLGILGSDAAYPHGTRVPRPRRITMVFGEARRFPRAATPQVPDRLLARTLELTRLRILQTMAHAAADWTAQEEASLGKRVRIALSACVVLPLASFLHATANPSLDPAMRPRAA